MQTDSETAAADGRRHGQHVETKGKPSLLPLWILLGFCSVLMTFLGGPNSIYTQLSSSPLPIDPKAWPPACCQGPCQTLRDALPGLNLRIYAWLDAVSSAMVVWTALSAFVTAIRVIRRIASGKPKVNDSIFFTEGAGLLLTISQIVSFVWAVISGDFFTAAMFAWWGPGFWLTVYFYLKASSEGRRVDWNQPALGPATSACPIAAIRRIPLKVPISWACKLMYVVYLAMFICLGLKWQVFAYSAWILNDQVSKLFLEQDADRFRRTFHDAWFTRVAYPLGLLYPLVTLDHDSGFSMFCAVFGVILLAAWVAGLVNVSRQGHLFDLPQDPTLLRNIMYMKPVEARVPSGPGKEE